MAVLATEAEIAMRGAIARDFNHPSIVAWCLFNETWGFGGQAEFMKFINTVPPVSGAAIKARGKKIEQRKRIQVDPEDVETGQITRSDAPLVEDMSVVAWEHLRYYGHGETDINSWHFYTGDYSTARRWVNEVVEQTYAGSTFNYVPGFKQEQQPLIASEFTAASLRLTATSILAGAFSPRNELPWRHRSALCVHLHRAAASEWEAQRIP